MAVLKNKKIIKKPARRGGKVLVKKTSIKKPVRRGRKVVKKITKKITALNLERLKKNPIIEPEDHSYWESKATFNPSAIIHDGKVHIVYRAIGDSDNSVLGYAGSNDGFTISDRFQTPIFFHFIKQNRNSLLPITFYSSGGGCGGGCEDPRLTLIGDTVYMLYIAFDGWNSIRVALTSISLDDFIAKHWNWKNPVFISPPGEMRKKWVLFPEKISGPATGGKKKYAIIHSISPEILIDYFDSLDELDGNNFIHSIPLEGPIWEKRDPLVRGPGPSPIKTKYGWLILYHKMEKHDSHRYKLWAMITDINNPTKILYNSKSPILEPDEWYENEGYKSGVIYSCGAVVKDGQLFVYYGGADKVSCVATANLDKFLNELVHTSVTVMKKDKLKIKI